MKVKYFCTEFGEVTELDLPDNVSLKDAMIAIEKHHQSNFDDCVDDGNDEFNISWDKDWELDGTYE